MMLRPSLRVLGPCLGITAMQDSDLTIMVSVQRGGIWDFFFETDKLVSSGEKSGVRTEIVLHL